MKDKNKTSSAKEETSNNKCTLSADDSLSRSESCSTTGPKLKLLVKAVKIENIVQKLLNCSKNGDWTLVDQLLKHVEKFVRNSEKNDPHPLSGISDPTTGMTPLMYAIKDDRISIVNRLIDLDADLNVYNNDNYNALHISVMNSREEIVKILLSNGADAAALGGPQKQTPVHLITKLPQNGSGISILRSLLNTSKCDIRLITDRFGRIPLFLAVETNNQSMCRELLMQQALNQLQATTPMGDTALHLAVRQRNTDIAKILIDYGAQVDIQNNEGQTPLHIASAEGDEILIKHFYDMNASASIPDHQDRTPMHLAAENGHASIIDYLAEKFRASIFERTKDGSTLMHIAALNGHSECANMLFKKGVFLHMPNKKGARPIHIAAQHGHVKIIKTLLQHGEKVDVTTNDNYTALHIAVENAKPAVVETLLGYGAEVHVRGGRFCETPLHIAARISGGDRCTLMLLKSGARPNLTTDNGQTPVHLAASHGNLTTLKLLLEDGGDPMHKSKNGETPLHLACRDCKSLIVCNLIDFVKARKGIDMATSYVNSVTNEGASALHYAAQIKPSEVLELGEDRTVVRALLNNGADVSLKTKQMQETVFHYCALAGNNQVLQEMISHMSATEIQKALNQQNIIGWTPLLIASHYGHMTLITTLLENHARVDVFDLEGRSALHLAAELGNLEVCDALLASKAFINSKSRVGRTPLHLAAINGCTYLVKSLIQDHGAVIDVLTLKKQTPLHLAADTGQLEVCKLLIELGASCDATDDLGQKPIHAAAMNNYAEVVQLFLQKHPNLVTAYTKDGNTCAHIAAMQGSVRVIEELMKFDKKGVISARNELTDSTPLQLAAKGGHAEVVRALVQAGALCTEENRTGFTAIHLAAQYGHGQVLEVMRTSQSLKLSSKKLGVTALHVAAYFGQTDTVRELLIDISGTVKSDAPIGGSLVSELGNESGMTPLHFAAYSGDENVVRLLLNSAGVQVEAQTTENGFNPLHLACLGGHIAVVGILLSRSAELLHKVDRYGKTGLHIAATYGHYQMVEVLLGQGTEINAIDKNGWTSLHCAAQAGYLDVVKLLVESGASPKNETNFGSAPIWFAAAEGHNEVLKYLMEKEHDTYALMEDKKFVYNMMVCSKSHNNKPIEEFVLLSPAPVDVAAKLSNIFIKLSEKEKERSKDLIAAGKQCEAMATELLALAAGADSAGRILTSVDKRNIEFLDILIENEQKEVIAHTVVQRYLQELWLGKLNWNTFRTILLFIIFLICPPVWIWFALPLGHKYSNVPIIKFMSYLTSHVYLMIFLALAGIMPPYKYMRPNLMPYWYEWCLLVMLSGLLLLELTNPSDKSGLGWIKLAVLIFGILGVALHMIAWIFMTHNRPTSLYLRNQLFALSFLLACVQILDFLSFHYLFGPWAIIIGNLMKDLARFLSVLAIFVFGFSMLFVALNQTIVDEHLSQLINVNHTFSEITITPIHAFEDLFFAVFGHTTSDKLIQTQAEPHEWIKYLIKLAFGAYLLVSVVVLINLLIAMMSDTYQRIQAQSDIEWKYGLSKLIRNMHRTTTAPSPLNLFSTGIIDCYKSCKQHVANKPLLLAHLLKSKHPRPLSPRSKMAAKWLTKTRKYQVQSNENTPFGNFQTFPEETGFSSSCRIEDIVNWDIIRKKYRILTRNELEKDDKNKTNNTDDDNTNDIDKS
ncbi:serine/threonine-protein phosphatase 6 regulatory ankyrin repeat subunit A-like [Chelonus insularis]|uniref:serine/threonine-protein phosphatase 6 regulatory ankyrin repeat subunit A-like n=1 Tax=Chelonus insularis TaxID=460826 RepID=UPI00158E31DC|nr:serine/threonine-protein phosphatase 6 regulatory ankyrin repeat subunit A-like [Chelonus insularis]